MPSMEAEISMAFRVGVPLNSRCSRKWVAPMCSGASSREPMPTHMPTATLRTVGMVSVTTRRPPGRTVRLTTPAPSRPACSVVVVTEPPSRASRPHRVSSPSRVAVVPLGGAAPAAGADAGAGAPRTLGLVGAVGRRGLGLGLAAGGLGLLLGGLLLDDLDGDERELAALVDLGDLHLDLLADVHDVLDVLDALAAVQLVAL